MKKHHLLAAVAVPLALSAGSAFATTYDVSLTAMNGSGVTGNATITVNSNDTVTVDVNASGLEANRYHPMHIHGFVGGPASALATPAQDLDHDGYIEHGESEMVAGHPLLSVVTSSTAFPDEAGNPAAYPMAAADGTLHFTQTYTFDLSDPAQAVVWGEVQNLDGRAFEIHGMSVPKTVGAHTPGEVNGIPGYKPMLPVAAGLITLTNGTGAVPPGSGGTSSVPEPASLALLPLALVALRLRAGRA